MAVKIKLTRLGKIRNPQYRIAVADARTRRDGRSIEVIGRYHPKEEPSLIEVDSERAQYWLSVGAQPTPQVEAILKLTGDWGKFKGDKNAKSTVKTKEAKAEFVADEKKKPVLAPKSEKKAPKAAEVAAEEAPAEDVAADTVSDGAADEAPAAEAADEAPAVGDEVEAAADAAADEPAADDADKA